MFDSLMFDKQHDFIYDPAKLKAAQCTRRAGKTYATGLYMFKEAYETDKCKCLYIGLTRMTAKRTIWNDVLYDIDYKLKLNTRFNKADLEATLPNSSMIFLIGVDSSPEDMKKALGQKYKLVVIDEAAFYHINMRKLIYEIVQPATIDYDGSVVLISTTSSFTMSLYYDVTNGIEPGWSVHRWSAKDNPHVRDKFINSKEALIKQNPKIVDTPMFKRMYLNQWVIDDSDLVYRFSRGVNIVNCMPKQYKIWHYILGIDLGWDDPTAFSVCTYNQIDGCFYVVETFKQSKMDFDEVAHKIYDYQKRYNFDKIVIDNASKQGVETMRKRYAIPFAPADKQGKFDHIQLLNTEFIQGKIKLLESTTTELQDEYTKLIWDELAKEKGKYIEHANCANHLSDATLYAWYYAYSFALIEPEEQKLDPHSEDWVDSFWRSESKKIVKNNENDIFGGLQ